MSCNNNTFIDNIKKQLESVETPDFSKVETALSEAEAAVNETISNITGFLDEAITEVNTSLHEMIEDLQNSFDQSDMAAKIAEIKKEFGEAVDDLDAYLDKATGGLSTALSQIENGFNNLDSDMTSAVNKLTQSFTEGLNLPGPCEDVPNIEKTPDKKIVEKPKQSVVPSTKPIEVKPVKAKSVTVTNFVARNDNVSDPLDDERIKAYIKQNEGLRLDAYQDASGYSIGYGHFIKPGEQYLFNGITKAQAESIFEADYYDHRDAALSIPHFAYHPGIVRLVLIDMTFNMGNGWWKGFPKMMEALSKNDYNEAANQIVDSAYYTQTGRRAKQNVAYMQQAADAQKATITPVEESQVVTTETEQIVEETVIEPAGTTYKAVGTGAIRKSWNALLRRQLSDINADPTQLKPKIEFICLNYHKLIEFEYGVVTTPSHWVSGGSVYTTELHKKQFEVNGTYSEDALWDALREYNRLHIAEFDTEGTGTFFFNAIEEYAKIKM